jgi:hypothetical protein
LFLVSALLRLFCLYAIFGLRNLSITPLIFKTKKPYNRQVARLLEGRSPEILFHFFGIIHQIGRFSFPNKVVPVLLVVQPYHLAAKLVQLLGSSLVLDRKVPDLVGEHRSIGRVCDAALVQFPLIRFKNIAFVGKFDERSIPVTITDDETVAEIGITPKPKKQDEYRPTKDSLPSDTG